MLEIRPPSPREAVLAAEMGVAGKRMDEALAEQKEFGAFLDASLPLFAEMTDVERAELRFALRCDPELREALADKDRT